MLKIEYAPQAQKDLLSLDKHIARRILAKIEENAMQVDPLARAKSLSGVLSGRHRYRIGSYRAIFIIKDDGSIILLTILTIKHRKEIYR